MTNDPMKEIGQAAANVAANYDKANISSRNMLLSPDFWTDVAKTLRGETFGNMTEAVTVKPGVIILHPTSVETNSKGRLLTILGSWFTMESKIVFDGVELETTMRGPDRLEATIPLASEPASVSITVRTGDHETAPPQTFTYTQAEDKQDEQRDGPDRIGDTGAASHGGAAEVSEGRDEPDA